MRKPRVPKTIFPKTIVVTLEGLDTRDEFLAVQGDNMANVNETTPCAVYELKRVGKIEVTRAIT